MRWEYDDFVESFMMSFLHVALPNMDLLSDDYANEFSILSAEILRDGTAEYGLGMDVPLSTGTAELFVTFEATDEEISVTDVHCNFIGEVEGFYAWSGDRWVPENLPDYPDEGYEPAGGSTLHIVE